MRVASLLLFASVAACQAGRGSTPAGSAASATRGEGVAPRDPFEHGRCELLLSLGADGRAALSSTPTVPVAASLVVDGGNAIAVDVSLPTLGDKPQLLSRDAKMLVTVRDSDAPVALPASFWLDPSTDDTSYLRAALATLFYRRMGLPTARTTYVRLALDGTDFGLFVAREVGSDPSFLGRELGPDSSLFAPSDRADFWSWQTAGFALVTGNETDRATIDLLVADLDRYDADLRQGSPKAFADAVADVLDLDGFLDFMAAETVVGHYGGYGGQQSDFALGVKGKLTFLPLRLEHSYPIGDAPDPTWSSARILRACIDESACRSRWAQALDKALALADSATFRAEASALRGLTQLELASDPSPAASLTDINTAQEAVLEAIGARTGWLRANAECLVPEAVDHDGDGYSGCTDDCDDDDPNIHPGAIDICGNLRDDDCDLHVDNGPGCPPCTRVPAYDPHWDWELCPTSRTWPAALADCRSRGGDLASIETLAEDEALVRAALQFDWSDWWIGISDREIEGAFVWSDGRPSGFHDWNAGEPNDSGGNEDCGHIASWAGGHWNDAPCDWWKFYVCERPRDASAAP